MSTQEIIAAIKCAPRFHGGKSIHWASNINLPARIAIAILSAPSFDDMVTHLHLSANAPMTSLHHFARGNKSDGTKWPELRAELTERGYQWREPHGKKSATAPSLPVADIIPPAPVVMLATTNKGEVITATPPKPDASPMIAKGGEFATKAHGPVPANGIHGDAMHVTRGSAPATLASPLPIKVCRKHDPASGDIIVTRTTTQTLKYGSDEHKAATILMAKHATPAV